ncbi:hypothetical protein ACWCOV_15250 [Kribbella sp. NPDC002412]
MEEPEAGRLHPHAAGNVYQAVAVEGSLDGAPYAGGKDVALTKYAPDGPREWTRSPGTSGTERAYGVAVSGAWVVVTGYTTGNQRWLKQFGVPGVADRSYTAAVDGAGDVYVAGFTDGALETSVGRFDGVLAKYSSDRRTWVRQFGTADDAADPFAEANVYWTTTQTGAQVSGLTNTDVFRTAFSSAGENTAP